MRYLVILFSIFLFACGKDHPRNLPVQVDDRSNEHQVTSAPTQEPGQKPEQKPTTRITGSDDIFGAQVSYEGSWRTERGKIFYDGKEVQFKGVNWFGFETSDLNVHGLWTGRSVRSFLEQVKELGFNALRVPLSPEALSRLPSSWSYAVAIDNLILVLIEARELGLYVMLDLHNCNYKSGFQVGTPEGCKDYSRDDWYKTLRELAVISKRYPNVMGIDLFNEPHKLSWRTWREWSDVAVKEILTVNPRILVIVEGVNSFETDNKGYWTFWGENLVEAADNPVRGPKSRIVYTPHVYGPSVAWQQYFGDPTFPANMEKIWDLHFGHMIDRGYTIMIGEWGGRYVDKDKVWQDAFVAYLKKRGVQSWFYWSLNANSGDTGGILLDDWKTVNQEKMLMLKTLM